MSEEVKEVQADGDTYLESPVPKPHDPEWSDYVLGHLQADEKLEGKPTVDGLRRLAEKFVGRIVRNETTVVKSPHGEDRSATVLVEVSFQDKLTIIVSSGAADVSPENTASPYSRYPTAVAETRAEGRALRKALKLRKVLTAEEMHGSSEEEVVIPSGIIDANQRRFIDYRAKGDGLNVEKFIKLLLPHVKSMNEVKNGEFDLIQDKLGKYHRETNTIPEEIKGYDENWQDKF